METGSFEDAEEEAANQFSMQEDEMASWLHYPVHESFEPDIYADLLYPAPPGNYAPSCRCSLIQEDLQSVEKYPAASQPPIPPWRSPVREFLASEPASGGCAANASSEPLLKPPPPEDKKRKAREADNNNCQSEDVEFKSINAKKQVHGSTSARRTRAAEVHNLSERKRRDRINEKMKALQELIPSCNKSDKASMLDEAIEYLKSLQLQVQMLCSMVPMVYPSFQPYMSPMGMRMGMGMDMGLSRPMLPFPSSLAGSSMPTLAATPHLGLRVTMPAFHVLNAIGGPSPNQPQIQNFADPYQHYHGLHQMQVPPPQNQTMDQPSASKGVGTLENHQSG